MPALVPVRLTTARGLALAAAASLIVLMPLGAAGIESFFVFLARSQWIVLYQRRTRHLRYCTFPCAGCWAFVPML